MLVHRSMSSVLAVLVAATALSCSDPAEPEVVTDVAVVGTARNIGVGQTAQFEGRAITNYGTRVDDQITWSVSSSTILGVTAELVTVSGSLVNRATVTARAAGAADLIATAGGRSASVRIAVSPPAP